MIREYFKSTSEHNVMAEPGAPEAQVIDPQLISPRRAVLEDSRRAWAAQLASTSVMSDDIEGFTTPQDDLTEKMARKSRLHHNIGATIVDPQVQLETHIPSLAKRT